MALGAGSQRSGCQPSHIGRGLPSWLPDGPPPSAVTLPFCACAERGKEKEGEVSSSSHKATGPIRLVLTLMTSFNLNYFLKVLSPDGVPWGVRALTYAFRKDTVQSVADLKCV